MCYEGRIEQRKWYLVGGKFWNQTPSSSFFVILVLVEEEEFLLWSWKQSVATISKEHFHVPWAGESTESYDVWENNALTVKKQTNKQKNQKTKKKTWYISPDNLFLRWNLGLHCYISTALKYLLRLDIGCDISTLFFNTEEVVALPIWLIILTTKSLDFWWVQNHKNEDQRICNVW